ncbi:hypothetical protein [Hansschlegelia sp. KR7-227]|jgi:hypothetical protein|uniref:hypothetical protein n=1 Tax=Hansschlegelia sp. KR7-227 TaxID=3400914 RepID=UPI003C0D4A87
MATASEIELPAEFDANFYRSHHADLRAVQDVEEHYRIFGMKEGRTTSPGALRETLALVAGSIAPVLEIGPFPRPLLRGSHVRYFDVVGKQGLTERALRSGADPANLPEIDYVAADDDLMTANDTFKAVFSTHWIQRRPDLIRHLAQVSKALEPGGHYFLVIPDKRYCFDHFLAPSSIAQVLGAHLGDRRTHALSSLIEHRALTTHNDAERHWAGDHANPDYLDSIESRTRAALDEYAAAERPEIDVHAWQFTPASFRSTIAILRTLGRTDFEPARVYETPRGRNEFTAVLRKAGKAASAGARAPAAGPQAQAAA